MAERFLIDSSAVIKYLNNSLPSPSIVFLDKELDKEVNMSIITKIEILAWNPPSNDDLTVIKKFARGAHIYPIDDRIGDIVVSIRKAPKMDLPVILVAARL